MFTKVFFALFSIALLIYMLAPGISSIDNFPALPDSAKSKLSGDTTQIPNVSAYFSDNFRDFVIPFYYNSYVSQSPLHIPAIRLNYPPEYAYTAIIDQTQSTYLEEFVYPLKESVYVNGLEPFEKDGSIRFWGASKFMEEGRGYLTKVTLRYHPSSIFVRFLVWVGITTSIFFLFKVGRKVFLNA